MSHKDYQILTLRCTRIARVYFVITRVETTCKIPIEALRVVTSKLYVSECVRVYELAALDSYLHHALALRRTGESSWVYLGTSPVDTGKTQCGVACRVDGM